MMVSMNLKKNVECKNYVAASLQLKQHSTVPHNSSVRNREIYSLSCMNIFGLQSKLGL